MNTCMAWIGKGRRSKVANMGKQSGKWEGENFTLCRVQLY